MQPFDKFKEEELCKLNHELDKFNPKSEEKAQTILEKNCLENSWANSCYGAGQRILGISENADDETRLEADKQDKWVLINFMFFFFTSSLIIT